MSGPRIVVKSLDGARELGHLEVVNGHLVVLSLTQPHPPLEQIGFTPDILRALLGTPTDEVHAQMLEQLRSGLQFLEALSGSIGPISEHCNEEEREAQQTGERLLNEIVAGHRAAIAKAGGR